MTGLELADDLLKAVKETQEELYQQMTLLVEGNYTPGAKEILSCRYNELLEKRIMGLIWHTIRYTLEAHKISSHEASNLVQKARLKNEIKELIDKL